MENDEAVIEKARRVLSAQKKLRWVMLGYAAVFLGFCGFMTLKVVRRLEEFDPEQLKLGFVFGLALAATWASFGLVGGICLGKFLAGFQSDFKQQELLVRYHDRLRDLGQLPDDG